MQAIAAVDRNWAIGNKGSLLVSIPNDHKMFRKITDGKTLIYGRKTLETFPMHHPLEGRRNIILSSNRSLEVKGAEVVHSVEELLELVGVTPRENPTENEASGNLSKDLSKDSEQAGFAKKAESEDESSDDLMVIGGASVYKELLPYCDTAYITKIDYAYEADAYFPNLDKDPQWELAEEGDEQTYFDVPYTFTKYQRIAGEANR